MDLPYLQKISLSNLYAGFTLEYRSFTKTIWGLRLKFLTDFSYDWVLTVYKAYRLYSIFRQCGLDFGFLKKSEKNRTPSHPQLRGSRHDEPTCIDRWRNRGMDGWTNVNPYLRISSISQIYPKHLIFFLECIAPS